MNDALNTFRTEIDAIDDQLIALLKARMAVVEKVGALKREHAPDLFAIRPAREAKLVRRVVESFKDSAFSAANAAHIWRQIIGASTHTECPLVISVLSVNDARDYTWLAREYFGPVATIIKQSHAKRVISDVLEGKANIGIVPSFTTMNESDWWTSLIQAASNAPKIFAHLPLLAAADATKQLPSALAIANVPPEDSGDDITLIVLQTDHDVSQHRLQSAFTSADIAAQWLSISSVNADVKLHLVELKGFVDEQSPALAQFKQTLANALQHVTLLGSYATPISIHTP